MRAVKLGARVGFAGMLLSAPGVAAQAQYGDARAPRINVSVEHGGAVSSNYIEPSIRLSEDAYVFAISVDVDRTIRILHPEYPGIAVRMNSRRALHLPHFFAGYGDRRRSADVRYDGYASSYYSRYDPGYPDTRGTIIALASRRPFNLDAVTLDGDWDMFAIDRIVGGRNPQAAAAALAQRIGARGEPIGRDFHRFTGGGHYYTSYYDNAYSYYGCNPTYSALGGFPGYGGVNYLRASQLQRAGYRVSFIGYDPCGQPRYVVSQPGVVTNPPRPPAVGAFPSARTPSNVPRNPGRGSTVPNGSVGSTTRTSDGFPDRLIPRAPPPDRAADRQLPPDRAQQPAKGSFPSERTRSAEPRERAEPARNSPPPERAQPASPPQREALRAPQEKQKPVP